MSHACSVSTRRPYGVARVCGEWQVARSSFYLDRRRKSSAPAEPPRRRGPKTRFTDAQLTERIREEIASSPFSGEGHRKVWARLRGREVRAGKPRVLRLMREAGLLAPQRGGGPRGPRHHTGTIRTEAPDVMWGTDATSTATLRDGQVTVFVAVDHCTSELAGIHASRRATRFEALEPVLQGVRARFGGVREGAAAGLAIRHDHGSQYMSRDFQNEIAFLGAESSPSFRPRSRRQRHRRALHPNPQGAGPVGPGLRHRRRPPPRPARMARPLQPGVARSAPRPSNPFPSAPRRPRRGRLITPYSMSKNQGAVQINRTPPLWQSRAVSIATTSSLVVRTKRATRPFGRAPPPRGIAVRTVLVPPRYHGTCRRPFARG